MAREVRYPTESDRELVSRNPKADAISKRLRERSIALIKNGELGDRVDDPLAELIERARSGS